MAVQILIKLKKTPVATIKQFNEKLSPKSMISAHTDMLPLFSITLFDVCEHLSSSVLGSLGIVFGSAGFSSSARKMGFNHS